MSIESPEPKNDQQAEELEKKQRQWNDKMAEMLKPDRYGYILDEGIRDTVVALQLLGFNTTQSDQGNYSDSPRVEVKAEDPRGVYEGEAELKSELMAERGIRPEEIDPNLSSFDRAKQVDIEGEARERLARENARYTPEFENWRRQTLEYAKKLQEVIDDFYRKQPPQTEYEDLRISVDFPYRGPKYMPYIHDTPYLRIKFRGQEDSTNEVPSESERLARVERARHEMKRFTDFLKDRFYSS